MADIKAAGADSAKRQGDKLKVGQEPELPKKDASPSGDSPKRQGDKLDHAAKEAAKT
jgi:hypothetical protein